MLKKIPLNYWGFFVVGFFFFFLIAYSPSNWKYLFCCFHPQLGTGRAGSAQESWLCSKTRCKH